MKKILFALSVLFFVNHSTFAQAPQGINYQGVARDSHGDAIGNTNVSVQITLTQAGTTVYQEHQSLTTDTFGLYSLVIGAPAAVVTQGPFASIPWSGGNILAQVDIDPLGGTAWTTVSTMYLQSVPYALYAQTAGNSGSGTVTSINTAAGELTGGPITSTGTVGLASTGVNPGAYGSATSIPTFTVDSKGRITQAVDVPLSLSAGTVTSVTATAPMSVVNPSTTPVISIPQANGSTSGFLDMNDWNTFNGKGNGTVTSITTGAGLTPVGTFTNTATIAADYTAAIWNASSLMSKPLNFSSLTANDMMQFNGTDWVNVPAPSGISSIITNGSGISSATAGSTYTLTVDNTLAKWNADKLQSFSVSATAPLTNDVLQYNGSAWTPAPVAGLPPGTTGQMLFNNAGVWTPGNTSNLTFNGTSLGIGNSAPAAFLDVVSTTTSPAIRATSGSGPAIVSNGPLQLNSTILDGTTSPGANGDVLVSQGPGIAPKWLPPPGSSLPAPQLGSILYANSATTWTPSVPANISSDGNSLSVTNTTTVGTAGTFITNNAGATNAPALLAQTNSSTGYAIRADNSSGAAIVATSGGPYVITGNLSGPAGGNAVVGYLRNSASGGTGIAGWVDNTSFGNGAFFENQNPGNAQEVLKVVNDPGSSGKSATFAGGSGVQIDQLQITNGASGGYVLTSDASGNASWQPAAAAGVSSVSVNAPLTFSGTASAPVIGIQQANAVTDGYLSLNDWNNFNTKLTTVAVAGPLMGNGTVGTPLQLGLNSGNIFVGDPSNFAAPVNMTGDVSITNTGVTTVNALRGTSLSAAVPAPNQVLQYNGVSWVPSTVALLPPGAPNQMLYNSGGAWVVSNTNNLSFNGTNMGIGNNAPAYPLDMTSTNATTTSNFINTGNGRAGNFQVINAASTATEALNVTNNSTGNTRGATFNTTNAGNTGSAVHAITAGSGNGVTAITTGSGNGISASTTGAGYSGLFSGGAGLKTDKITVSNGAAVGSILTANSAAGDAVWSTPSAVVASGGGWSTGGNAAVPGNFVGTTNTNPLEIATANATAQPILFKVGGIAAGDEKMRVDANGNVGIGVPGPASQLHVFGSNPEIRVESMGGAFTSGFGIKTALQQWFIGQETGAAQIFRIKDVTAGVVRMQISQDGNVGINTTSPGAQLDVVSTSTVATINAVNSGSVAEAGTFSVTNGSNSAAAIAVGTAGTGHAIVANAVGGNGINAVTTGTTGSAGFFQNTNAGNNNPVVNVTASGAGPGVNVNTSGTGAAVEAVSTSASGSAGFFMMNNASNNNYAVSIQSNANSGAALVVSNTGSGRGIATDKFQMSGASPTPNAVLVSSNGSGDATWSGAVNFAVEKSTTPVNSTFATTMAFNSILYQNPGGSFSGTTFTTPAAGLYHFDCGINMNIVTPLGAASNVVVRLVVNGTSYRESQLHFPSGYTGAAHNILGCDVQLGAGAQVRVDVFQDSGQSLTPVTGASGIHNYFNGHLVH